MDDELRRILSKDTQKSIEGLVRSDLERFVNRFGYTLVKLSEVDKPKLVNSSVAKAKRKKITDKKKVELPMVFGRRFPSVTKCAEFFKVTPATLYYWLDKGYDIEERLKERGNLPESVDGVVITRKKNGEKVWK